MADNSKLTFIRLDILTLNLNYFKSENIGQHQVKIQIKKKNNERQFKTDNFTTEINHTSQ